MIDQRVFVRGKPSQLADWISLRAGPLTMEFDPENLWLRYIRCGDREVLRAIYAAVRDQNWGTVRPRVSHMRVNTDSTSFKVEFDVACVENEIDFAWKGTLLGDADGSVRFIFDGQARSSFLRSRIGLCVLHPLNECVGHACRVEHVDGSVEEAEFPALISPSQPMRRIRALTHEIRAGLKAEVRLTGDVFEMEDQRNWTDASFKTYSTPLDLPYPVRVEPGERVQQEVRLTMLGATPSQTVDPAAIPTLTVSTKASIKKPTLGLCVASHGQPLSRREIERLKMLHLSHLRVDLHPSAADWATKLKRAVLEANQLGVGLYIALHLTDAAEQELRQVLSELSNHQPRVLLWLIFQTREKATSERWIQLARETLAQYDPAVPIAAGTDAYFAELNRNRPSKLSLTLPCFSLNPQVHAFDDASLIENLGGQADTVRTACDFTHRPAVVSPVTLRPRFNPNATTVAGEAAEHALPPEVDARQLSLLGAAWTLGSIAELSSTGRVHSLTYYETTGWRGVMETETGSLLPEQFPSIPAAVFPLFHVLADLADCTCIGTVHSTQPLSATGLALSNAQGQVRVLVANLRARSQLVRVQLSCAQALVRMLEERNVIEAMTEPDVYRRNPGDRVTFNNDMLEVHLQPYAIARLDALDNP